MGNPVTRWQMVAKQPEVAARFYATLFGWKVDTNNGLGYREVDTDSEQGIGGGIWPSPPDGHNFVQLFIEVDDIDRYVEKAISLGAKVIVPKSELPDGDSMAIILDPSGITFGLHRPAR